MVQQYTHIVALFHLVIKTRKKATLLTGNHEIAERLILDVMEPVVLVIVIVIVIYFPQRT